MSIASRITAITGHITDIYDTLELGGDTTQNKNIVSINTEIKREYKDFLANGTDTLWNNWEKVSGTGETLSLSPTIKAKMKVDLKGNTYQYSTTGKNLFKGIFRQGVANGASVANRVFSDNNYYIEQGQTYTFSTNAIESGYRFAIAINDTTFPALSPYEYDSGWQTGTFTFTPIVSGYLGVGVSKSNDENLTPSDLASFNWQLEKGNQATNWEEYTGGQPAPSPSYPFPVHVVSGDNTIRVANGDNTEYEEYPISLGNIELCKIGTYQDSIVKDNGKWYLNKQIGKVVLNGSEAGWVTEAGNTGRYNLPTPNAILGSSTNNPVLSDRFQQRFAISNYSIFLSGANHLICIIYQDITWNVETWKTWLSNNNTSIYYALATPTYEEITDTTLLSQLEALAYSYEGTTNISQVNDDMPFVLDITALKEMS